MKEGNPLDYLSSRLVIDTCKGEHKLFSKLTNWELLNLKSNDILDIPDRLYQEYGECRTLSLYFAGGRKLSRALYLTRDLQFLSVRCNE